MIYRVGAKEKVYVNISSYPFNTNPLYKRFNPLNDRLIENLLNRIQAHREKFHFDTFCIHKNQNGNPLPFHINALSRKGKLTTEDAFLFPEFT